MNIPPRAQMRRVKGFKMAAGSVLCCRPGPLGNPFTDADRHVAVEKFEEWAREALGKTFDRITPEQRRFCDAWRAHVRTATKLYCYCNIAQACHVDVFRKLLREGY